MRNSFVLISHGWICRKYQISQAANSCPGMNLPDLCEPSSLTATQPILPSTNLRPSDVQRSVMLASCDMKGSHNTSLPLYLDVYRSYITLIPRSHHLYTLAGAFKQGYRRKLTALILCFSMILYCSKAYRCQQMHRNSTYRSQIKNIPSVSSSATLGSRNRRIHHTASRARSFHRA